MLRVFVSVCLTICSFGRCKQTIIYFVLLAFNCFASLQQHGIIIENNKEFQKAKRESRKYSLFVIGIYMLTMQKADSYRAVECM